MVAAESPRSSPPLLSSTSPLAEAGAVEGFGSSSLPLSAAGLDGSVAAGRAAAGVDGAAAATALAAAVAVAAAAAGAGAAELVCVAAAGCGFFSRAARARTNSCSCGVAGDGGGGEDFASSDGYGRALLNSTEHVSLEDQEPSTMLPTADNV